MYNLVHLSLAISEVLILIIRKRNLGWSHMVTFTAGLITVKDMSMK